MKVLEYNTYREALVDTIEALDAWLDAPSHDSAAELTRLSDIRDAAEYLVEERETAKANRKRTEVKG